jgi:hypothetical protein
MPSDLIGVTQPLAINKIFFPYLSFACGGVEEGRGVIFGKHFPKKE